MIVAVEQQAPDALENVRMQVICAWCERIIRSGPGPVSHGVCDICLPEVLAEVLERTDTTAKAADQPEDDPRLDR